MSDISVGSIDVTQILSKIVTDQSVWNDFGQAYCNWCTATSIAYLNRLRDVRNLSPDTDRYILINTLSLLGQDIDLTNFSNRDLYVLCKDLTDWDKWCGTEKGLLFLTRLCQSVVKVVPLYSREYCWKTISTLLGPDLTVTCENNLLPYFNINISCSGHIVPTNLYMVSGNKIVFDPSYLNKNITVIYSDFLTELPTGAKTLDQGGLWFKTTHVIVESSVDIREIFYKVAPINLVIYQFLVNYDQRIDLDISVVNTQIVVQQI